VSLSIVNSRSFFSYLQSLIGNGGDTPNGSGGMIPSTGPPFAMTRWVAQTQENHVSATPYNVTKKTVHGFQATRQPAIWMGESGSIALVPGVAVQGNAASIEWEFDKRGLPFDDAFRVPGEEIISPAYYAVELSDEMNGHIRVEQASSTLISSRLFLMLTLFRIASRAAHFRMRFEVANSNDRPYLYIDVARPSVTGSDPANRTQPIGYVEINAETREICGFSTERQDDIITPVSGRETASGFHGYFCVRIDAGFDSHGIIKGGEILRGANKATGGPLGAYVLFTPPTNSQLVFFIARVGTSFVSIDQARMNLELELPGPQPDLTDRNGLMVGTLEHTAASVRQQWKDKLDLFRIEGATDVQKEIFYTAVARTLQYPSEQHEYKKYWSGYVGDVVPLVAGEYSYTGYSIWDTFRAVWGWQILFTPERLPGFVHSMLQDYKQVNILLVSERHILIAL
jgi:putative alpha-1,2-mannosidase